MFKKNSRQYLVSTTMLASLGFVPEPAIAQETASDDNEFFFEEIVVTGSRIKRTGTTTSAPVAALNSEFLSDRGYVSAAQALNTLTAARPQVSQADGSGASSGSGQQFPDLFGLGAGRTLTLVNGRRMVTSSSGLGDAQVDANIIPLGLLERVEVVQAGGAAVYGSDAIAGVVNYIVKDDFEGLELDAQYGTDSRGDYPTYSGRVTFGANFADDRGNIAVNVEYSNTDPLYSSDRDIPAIGRITQSNSEDTGPNDGIPSVSDVFDAAFWNFNSNGIIYTIPAPLQNFLLTDGSTPLQFNPDGSIDAYDPGNILGIPFASGGEGYPYSDLTGLYTGVERVTGNLIAHYDLSDKMTLSTELLYAKTVGTEVPQGYSRTVLYGADTPLGALFFNIANPFLSDEAIASLSSAYPGFAFGAPLFLSKYFLDAVPDNQQTSKTETYRALVSLDGEFESGGRDFYWSVYGSYARVNGQSRRWEVDNAKFANAFGAVQVGDDIICAINADANASNDDPSCSPVNPFGFGNVSEAAQQYVGVLAGMDYVNEQIDFVASLGGDVLDLPAGTVKFNVAYEHRDEKASFTPLEANQLGLFGIGEMEQAVEGKYNTNELSAELLIPIVGGDFTLSAVQELELSTAYRYVDNSAAGIESVWDIGLRYVPVDGVTLRMSRSRNFRAPTLTQLFAPSSTALNAIGNDPCDADNIDAGSNPIVRRANCEAEWAAHPEYGDLASFQDPAENFSIAAITTGGNADLRNEISNTFTYGVVLQPKFAPGLTITADRIEIDLEDGLSAFTVEDFAATCYDTPDMPEDICGTFTRQGVTGEHIPGTIITGLTTTFNAGVVKYRGEVYNLNYMFGLDDVFGDGTGDMGTLQLNVEATHNSLFTSSVTGTVFTRIDGTVSMPEWVARLNVDYAKGPLRFSYQAYRLNSALAEPNATIENNPHPVIGSNTVHSISGQYEFESFVLRAGVNNFTDKLPSFPSRAYGDIIGRSYYVGVTTKF